MPSNWALARASGRCMDGNDDRHRPEQCTYCLEAGEDLDAAYQKGERRGRERAAETICQLCTAERQATLRTGKSHGLRYDGRHIERDLDGFLLGDTPCPALAIHALPDEPPTEAVSDDKGRVDSSLAVVAVLEHAPRFTKTGPCHKCNGTGRIVRDYPPKVP